MSQTSSSSVKPETRQVKIAPSLICTDLCNLERDVKMLEAIGVDLLHVDLLDARFSPSMPIGIDVVRKLRFRTSLPFDVHLMVQDNEYFIEEMIDIGVQRICFHVESAFHIDRLIDLVKEKGIEAGLALNPATPLTVLDFVLEKLDYLLLMLINPGFAGHKGEKQVPYAPRKVFMCRDLLDRRNHAIPIEVDGRVSVATIADLVEAGASILVAGSSSLFDPDGSWSENMKRMRAAIHQGVGLRQWGATAAATEASSP